MKHLAYRKSTIPENAKRVFEGTVFDVYQWEQKLYDGTTAVFEKIARSDTAVIYPVLEDGKILLIKDSQPQRDTVITAPSGRLEEGETPEEGIVRELLEETGYEPKDLVPFYTVQPYEKIDWQVNVFIGKGCRKIAEPKLDPGEKIELYPVSFDELLELSTQGLLRQEGFALRAFEAKLDSEKMRELKAKFVN